ncbi:MAG: EAL domain-containing protein [Ketobacteraceae bacterium]|nr:EAL domain-containing protein [Ketobacteraceae bacterium]
MRLQTKILGILIPLIILPMILVGAIAYQQINTIAISNARGHIETLLNQIKFNFQTHLWRAEKSLDYIASNSLFSQYVGAEENQRYALFYKPLKKSLQSLLQTQPEYLEIKLLLADGTEDISVGSGDAGEQSISDITDKIVTQLRITPDDHTIILNKNDHAEKGSVLVTKPVYREIRGNSRRLFGHILINMDIGFINQLPTTQRANVAPELLVTNEQGVVFYSSDQSLREFGRRLSRSNIRTKNFFSLTDTTHNREVMLAITQNIESNIYATGIIPKSRLVSGASELSQVVVLVTVSITLLFALVLFTVIRVLVTTPLARLSRMARDISQGDMDSRIDIDQDDEVGELAQVFDTMRANLKRSTQQIQELAYYDSLTGLPNKITFIETIHQLLEQAKENDELISVLFFDLDNFKNINDGLGHDMGDLLLQEVSRRLKDCIRATDLLERAANLPEEAQSHLIARMGGDEFTLVLSQINSIEESSKVAVRILSKLSQPFILEEHEIYIGASIGIACFPHDGDTPEILLKHADIAMYEAKARGKNNFQYFDHKMNEPVSERLALESSMRAALDNEEFRIVFQPRVPMNHNHRYEFEALIRWQHPEKGFVSPGLFIPVAEETGFIQHIGDWILDKACEQIKEWLDAGYGDVMVSINLSPVQFNYGSPSNSVRNALSKYDLHPRHLELEITESGLMQNENTAANLLSSLKEIGVRIALDDFGTGYSSLAYLLRFPIDTLKIDRAFIRNLTENPQAVAVLKSITGLAESLNLETVAEGVETEEQLNIVQEMGCRIIQGFLFAKPSPADEAMAFFDKLYKERLLTQKNA